MSEHLPEIQSIPIRAITVLNPRERNKREFNDLVTSIARLGLKKPITVSQRKDGGYDLVCGQGRVEAFLALGQTEIPAVVLQLPKEDCFVLSLVENMARRHQAPLELLHEIASLRGRISGAARFGDVYQQVGGLCGPRSQRCPHLPVAAGEI